MLKKEIREIFELCMRTQEETNVHVSFDMYGKDRITVLIRENEGKRYDGSYYTYPSDLEYSEEQLKAAKTHLERLLEESDGSKESHMDY